MRQTFLQRIQPCRTNVWIPPHILVLAIAICLAGSLTGSRSLAQSTSSAPPDAALSEALSAACREDSPAFANLLTEENAAAFRALPGPQRTAMMKRFVLLDEPGRALLSTSGNGHKVVRCESPGDTTEMRLGESRVHENLAFVPLEIPVGGEEPRTITIGLVREGGKWKLISVGLVMLDVAAMARQWEKADLETSEDNAIADLRMVATALNTYRSAYGKLPDSLESLGPAPPGGISPDAAGLLDSDLATGNKDGYAIRYTIIPSSDNSKEDDTNKTEKFALSSSPLEYGKAGRRSFFLDSSGVLHGADKQGGTATATDPRIGSS